MQPVPQPTAPFGRRPLSLAMMAAQAVAKACPEDAVAHKWRIVRDVTEAKERFGVSDRALAVLSALLTFHPVTALAPGADLVVFPSNRELSMRAHGPSPATLRRALAQLVEAGLLIRRDSPNGKRYARRDADGSIARAFGFDLTPLLARAPEFLQAAQEVRAAARARMLLREEISLQRREIAKTLAAAAAMQWPGPWSTLAQHFANLGGMPARAAAEAPLYAMAESLGILRVEVDNCLSAVMNSFDVTGNESHDEPHHQNSKTDPDLESERVSRQSPLDAVSLDHEAQSGVRRHVPLPMVLEACPDIVLYAKGGIRTWSDLLRATTIVRPTLGISPSAWEAAITAMGEEQAAVVLAAILQRAAMINAPGGYLHTLTEKARTGRFSVWPMLLALWRLRQGGPGGAFTGAARSGTS